MSPDSPPSPPSSPPPPPPPTSMPPPPPSAFPPGIVPSGWYSGPFPPPGWDGREGFWPSVGKTAARMGCGGLAFGLGVLVALGILAGVIAAIVAAAGGAANSSASNDDFAGIGSPDKFVEGDRSSANRLLLIRVSGVILGDPQEAPTSIFFSEDVAFGYEIKRKLQKAARDDSIKGVVMEFQTPGGTVYGAAAIADGIKEYQQSTGKPVLAYVEGLSASGGMWGMAPATKILADRGSLIGSIGVILGTFPTYNGVIATEGGILGGGVTTKDGITYTTLSAGRGKDVGSPYRPMTDEEKRTLQKGLDNLYTQFVDHVATNRKIEPSFIRNTLGAMIFDNDQAKEFGLIDGTANRQEAYTELASLAKLRPGDWQVVRFSGDRGFLAGIFSKSETKPPAAAALRICFPANAMLTYYGDPAALCPR